MDWRNAETWLSFLRLEAETIAEAVTITLVGAWIVHILLSLFS